MLSIAIDPDLVTYRVEDLYDQSLHSLERLSALTLHRRFANEYGVKLIISSEMAALLYELSCWNSSAPDFHDLKSFFLQDLVKASYLESNLPDTALIDSAGLACFGAQDPRIEIAWKRLLACIVCRFRLSSDSLFIATWPNPVEEIDATTLTVTVSVDGDLQSQCLLLVRDETSWIDALASRDFWPDIKRCVSLYFLSDSGMRQHPQARSDPLEFKCSDGFLRSLESRCDSSTRPAFVKALSKKVYGINDASLRDESFRSLRRFRVNDFWRVHYRYVGNSLILEEFGPHDMGFKDSS